MKAKRRQIESMKKKIQHGHGRSSLFVWMLDHHAEMMTKDRAGRMPWTELCVDFVGLGLTDGDGKAPTAKRAGETWRAVCTEVEARAARAHTAPRPTVTHRSRAQDDWQPPIAPATPVGTSSPPIRSENSPALGPSPQLPTPEEATGNSPLDDLPPEAKAKIDKLRQAFAETDRKRFGRF